MKKKHIKSKLNLKTIMEYMLTKLANSNLYSKLDSIKDIEEKRELIRSSFKFGRIPSMISDSKGTLTDLLKIPYDDNKICFPFVVGQKYKLNKSHTPIDEFSFVYLLAIAQFDSQKTLVVVNRDENIGVFYRNELQDPINMQERTKKLKYKK